MTVVDILQDNSRVSPKRHFMYRQSEFFLDLLVKLYSDWAAVNSSRGTVTVFSTGDILYTEKKISLFEPGVRFLERGQY